MNVFYNLLDSFFELMGLVCIVVVCLWWYNFYKANKYYHKRYNESNSESEREKIKNEWTLYNLITSFFHTRWW